MQRSEFFVRYNIAVDVEEWPPELALAESGTALEVGIPFIAVNFDEVAMRRLIGRPHVVAEGIQRFPNW